MAEAAAAAAPLEPLETPRSFLEPTRAAAVGDDGHLAQLIEADAKLLGAKDELSCDPLSWASRNTRLGVVSYLLGKDADLESKSFGGMRPLHHACHGFSEDVIKELLAKKADPNSMDDAGNTPFHYACRR